MNNKYDWHLPSRDELNQMYVNLHQQGVGGFASDGYWSSSEISSLNAWVQHFGAGSNGVADKSFSARVRAVRALRDHEEIENVFSYLGQEYQAYWEDAPKEMDWNDAINWCERLNIG